MPTAYFAPEPFKLEPFLPEPLLADPEPLAAGSVEASGSEAVGLTADPESGLAFASAKFREAELMQ